MERKYWILSLGGVVLLLLFAFFLTGRLNSRGERGEVVLTNNIVGVSISLDRDSMMTRLEEINFWQEGELNNLRNPSGASKASGLQIDIVKLNEGVLEPYQIREDTFEDGRKEILLTIGAEIDDDGIAMIEIALGDYYLSGEGKENIYNAIDASIWDAIYLLTQRSPSSLRDSETRIYFIRTMTEKGKLVSE